MKEILDSDPVKVHENVLATWKVLGPLDIESLVDNAQIEFNIDKNVVECINMKDADGDKYSVYGQVNSDK